MVTLPCTNLCPRAGVTPWAPACDRPATRVPQAVVAHTAQRTRLTVAWEGGSTRDLEGGTGTGHWYRIGEELVDVRGVDIPDGPGTPGDESLVSIDSTMRPQQIVACDIPRWSMATSFQECRDYLPRESTTGDGQATVRRCSPCCWG